MASAWSLALRRAAAAPRGWAAVRALAFVAAAALAYNGARVLQDSSPSAAPTLDNFDAAAGWLGLALLATLVAAWRPRPIHIELSREAVAGFWRAHWVEIVLFSGIIAFGIFMRAFRFGETLPPSDGICCEEDINGGAAYRALEGDRPLLFPLVRWTSAGGFLLFGETTLGLRFFFVVLGVITVPLLYFLLRQLVSRSVALFGMALYAAAWWPSLRARQASEGTVYTILLALLLVYTIRRRSPIGALLAGVVAALVSYEYEPHRVVPIYAAGFVAVAAAWAVLARRPWSWPAVRERARALIVTAWHPALVFLMAAGIVLVPLIIGTQRGYDLYLTSVHRQEDTRGGPLFEEDWAQHLKWEADIFLPFGPNSYPISPPRDSDLAALLDPMTASLIVAGLIAGIVLVHRGFRLLFVAWMLLSLGAGAFVLESFGPWKFAGLVPVGIVLAAFLIDDMRRLLVSRFGLNGERAAYGVMAAGAVFAFAWNADALYNDIGPSEQIQRGYGGPRALSYDACAFLRDRPAGNVSYVYAPPGVLGGFAQPFPSRDAELRAWGDFDWVCRDLDGTLLAAPAEAWPLRDLPDGPVTLLFADPHPPLDELQAHLERVYPAIGGPDYTHIGPGNTYRITAYEVDDPAVVRRTGLHATYTPLDGGEAQTRVDAVQALSWDETPPPVEGPFRVRWQGLVYLPEGGSWMLRADTELSTQVTVDDVSMIAASTQLRKLTDIRFDAGWHAVHIEAEVTEAVDGIALVWSGPDGAQLPLEAQDLFPLDSLSGWTHRRTGGTQADPSQIVTQRIDFAPHFSSGEAVRAPWVEGFSELFLTEETWSSAWHVDEGGEFVISPAAAEGTVSLVIDGETVLDERPGAPRAVVTLEAGGHTIELRQTFERAPRLAGMTLTVERRTSSGGLEPVELDVQPF